MVWVSTPLWKILQIWVPSGKHPYLSPFDRAHDDIGGRAGIAVGYQDMDWGGRVG